MSHCVSSSSISCPSTIPLVDMYTDKNHKVLFALRMIKIIKEKQICFLEMSDHSIIISKYEPPLNNTIKLKINCNTNNKQHYCYLLQSSNQKYSRRTYIGYTTDPKRRLQQHNGEITGGAKRTKKARPWKMICYISGFPTQRSALQYEWINNHPKTKRWNVNGRIKTISNTLIQEKWTSTSILSSTLSFTVNWLVPGYQLIFPSEYYPHNVKEIFYT